MDSAARQTIQNVLHDLQMYSVWVDVFHSPILSACPSTLWFVLRVTGRGAEVWPPSPPWPWCDVGKPFRCMPRRRLVFDSRVKNDVFEKIIVHTPTKIAGLSLPNIHVRTSYFFNQHYRSHVHCLKELSTVWRSAASDVSSRTTEKKVRFDDVEQG